MQKAKLIAVMCVFMGVVLFGGGPEAARRREGLSSRARSWLDLAQRLDKEVRDVQCLKIGLRAELTGFAKEIMQTAERMQHEMRAQLGYDDARCNVNKAHSLAHDAYAYAKLIGSIDHLVAFLDRRFASDICAEGPGGTAARRLVELATDLAGWGSAFPEASPYEPASSRGYEFWNILRPVRRYITPTVASALSRVLQCYGRDGVACASRLGFGGNTEAKCLQAHDAAWSDTVPGIIDARNCSRNWLRPAEKSRAEYFRENCDDFVRDLYVARSALVRRYAEEGGRVPLESQLMRASRADVSLSAGYGASLIYADVLYVGKPDTFQRGGTCGWNAMQNLLALDLLMGQAGRAKVDAKLSKEHGTTEVRLPTHAGAEALRDVSKYQPLKKTTLEQERTCFNQVLGATPASVGSPSSGFGMWARIRLEVCGKISLPARLLASRLNHALWITEAAGISAIKCQPRASFMAGGMPIPTSIYRRRSFYINRDWLADGYLSCRVPVFHIKHNNPNALGAFEILEHFPLRGCLGTYLQEMREDRLDRILFFTGIRTLLPGDNAGHAIAVALIKLPERSRPLILFMDSSGFRIVRNRDGDSHAGGADIFGNQYQLLLGIMDRLACYVQHDELPEAVEAHRRAEARRRPHRR